MFLIGAPKKQIENVNFVDEKMFADLETESSFNHKNLIEVLFHLALCHSIIIDERTGKYNASSPDELALVNAAKFFGCEFVKRDEENTITIRYKD